VYIIVLSLVLFAKSLFSSNDLVEVYGSISDDLQYARFIMTGKFLKEVGSLFPKTIFDSEATIKFSRVLEI